MCTRKLTHSIAPPLQVGPAALGSDLVRRSAPPFVAPNQLSSLRRYWFSQELCRPQIWFIVVFVLPYFKVHKLKLCYLSVACSQFLACFTVQFSRCSSNLLQGQIEMLALLDKHFNPISIGGGYRIRTGDPLLAKQVLYQLS